MRWLVLLCVAVAATAQAQSTAYYCDMSPASQATIYFSDIFSAPSGMSVTRIESGFAYFLINRYKEGVTAKAHCFVQIDMREAEKAHARSLMNYRMLRWRVIETHWRY